ncbi:MAG: hypothetical protein C0508_04205 [Cyanobacteria bacterium PR.023]|nr:hypothetical protein [Cyanobacteria bacterium DS2.008]MBA4074221.1 hypothetical protein [Cyanobacteria bacterium PR.023]
MTLKLIVGLCEEHHSLLKAIMPKGSLREWGEHSHECCDFDCEDKNVCSNSPTHWHMLKVTPEVLIPVQPGSVTSEAKAEAARINGAKGGRPIVKAWRPWCDLHKPDGARKMENLTKVDKEEYACAKRGCKQPGIYSF